MDINNFPKAKKILLDYFIKETIERNNNLEYKMFKTDDVETIEYLAETFLNGALKDSPRALFDVFDDNNLAIIIFIRIKDDEKKKEFSYWFLNDKRLLTNIESAFDNRKECELAAIWKGIELLENETNN